MAMKKYTTFSRSPKLNPHHQMQFHVTPRGHCFQQRSNLSAKQIELPKVRMDLHHQMQYSVIPKTPFFLGGGILFLYRRYRQYIVTPPADRALLFQVEIWAWMLTSILLVSSNWTGNCFILHFKSFRQF